jgi:hypothetical protein
MSYVFQCQWVLDMTPEERKEYHDWRIRPKQSCDNEATRSLSFLEDWQSLLLCDKHFAALADMVFLTGDELYEKRREEAHARHDKFKRQMDAADNKVRQ